MWFQPEPHSVRLKMQVAYCEHTQCSNSEVDHLSVLSLSGCERHLELGCSVHVGYPRQCKLGVMKAFMEGGVSTYKILVGKHQ